MALSMGAPLPLSAVAQTQPSTSANAAPRHLDPRTSLAVLAAINVQMALMQSLFAEMGVPANVSVGVCVAFRFLPTMGREFSAVADAMKTRGIALTPRSVVRHPAKTAEHFLVPVIARLGQIADELGNAVVVRGVGASAHRTSYYRLKVRAIDVACLIAAMVLLALSVCFRAGVL